MNRPRTLLTPAPLALAPLALALATLLPPTIAIAFTSAPTSQPNTQPTCHPPTSPAAHSPDADLPGSTRNARIARVIPPDATDAERALTFFAANLSDEQIAELRTVAPNVSVIRIASRDEAIARAAEADAIDGRLVSADLLAKADRLVWVHSPSAGVERLVTLPGVKDRASLVLTNARGVHGPAIADHAMGMLLSLTRQLPTYAAAQARHEWARDVPEGEAIALHGKTMLVVGIGGIGEEIARRAHGFGMRIIATRRSDSPSPAFVERVGKPGDLGAMLPEADVVAICVPLTPETQNLFDAAMIGRMKPGSYLINIARGRIVETDALIAALNDGRIAGAALDVTDPEPLPKDHALWDAPNVLITPHVAADGELTDQRWWALLKENIRRFGAGEPLLNCVDVAAGY